MLEKENEEVAIEQRYIPANDKVLCHIIQKLYCTQLTVTSSSFFTTTTKSQQTYGPIVQEIIGGFGPPS